MGFRQAAVLTSVCFVLGALFVCFTVDHKLLFGQLTDQVIEDGFLLYANFYNAPPAIKTLLHTLIGIGLAGLIGKLHKWDESAIFFDGSSLAAYVFAIALYLSVTVPALRTIVDPVEGVDTREDRIEAMRVLAAGNTIIVVLLGAILALQSVLKAEHRITELTQAKYAVLAKFLMLRIADAGQEYAKRTEAKEVGKLEEQEKAAASAEKKEQ